MKNYLEARSKIEQWKPVSGYEGLYAVSNFGNIVSVMFRNNICTKPKIQPISPYDNGKGYFMVQLSGFDGKKTAHYVHRLVANAFIENPNNLPVVNHIDYDRGNNKAENLEWTTQKENVNYSSHLMKKPKSKSKPTNTGEKYISKKNNKYVVFSRKQFKTLEEAIAYRNEVMNCGE